MAWLALGLFASHSWSQSAGTLRDLESRAQWILAENRAAVVSVEVRPAAVEVVAASATLLAATPTVGGGTEDRLLIDMLARDVDGSLRQRADGTRFPEPASGETFPSYLARVTEQNRRIWQGSVRRATGLVLDGSGHIAAPAQLLRYRKPGEPIAVRVNGAWMDATVLGVDRFTGVAVLVAATAPAAGVVVPATAIVREGQFVLGIESPMQGPMRVQWGTISALNRRLPDLESVGYVPFIETTLQLLPGGTGSPVFDVEGRLLGVILEGRRMESGALSYVLPAGVLHQVAGELIAHGSTTHGSLGADILVPGRPDDQARRQQLNVPAEVKGVMVRQVWPGGPAQAAGLAADDVLLTWEGAPLSDWRELVWLIRMQPPGSEVKISLWRAGETKSFTVKMGEPPARRP